MISLRIGLVLVLLAPAAAQAAPDCTATPLPAACLGSGTPGPAGPTGATGPAGPAGPQGAAGNNGSNGVDGKDGAAGPAGPPGKDASADKAVALGMALSGPIWLETRENFAIAGSVAAFESREALALSGVARIQGGLSLNGALGLSDDGRTWGGRAGVRYGW